MQILSPYSSTSARISQVTFFLFKPILNCLSAVCFCISILKMRFFLIVTATLNLLASSALSQSTPSSFADWIDDSFSPSCVAECLKDSYENALGGDCGENAVSSRDEDTINCICQKFIDVDFSSDVMDGLLDCEIDRCDISSFDPGDSMPNGTEFPGLDSLCPDVFKGMSTCSTARLVQREFGLVEIRLALRIWTCQEWGRVFDRFLERFILG